MYHGSFSCFYFPFWSHNRQGAKHMYMPNTFFYSGISIYPNSDTLHVKKENKITFHLASVLMEIYLASVPVLTTGMKDKPQMEHIDSAALSLLDSSNNFLTSLQIKKKSQQKAKQEERMSKEFTKMEEAAMKAYQEDLKRMEREAAGTFSKFCTTDSLFF